MDVQLWTVECGFTFGFVVVEVQVIHGGLQQGLGLLPHLIVGVVLLGVLRVTQGEAEAVVGDVEVLVDGHDQLQDLGKFGPDLVESHEGVTVVQGHFTNPLQTGEGTGLFVTVHHPEFGNPQWQVTVGPDVVLVDLDVAWAVHWPQFQHFTVTHVHWWEHVVTVVFPVTRSLVGIQVHQNGGVNVLVVVGNFTVDDVTFDRPPNRSTLWHPVWQPSTDLRINEEEVELVTDYPVVTFTGFLTLLQIFSQGVLLVEDGPIDPLEHWVG